MLFSIVAALYVNNKILVRIPVEYRTMNMDVWNVLPGSVDIFSTVDDLKQIPYEIVDTEVEKRARLEHQRLSRKPKLDADEPISNFFNDFRTYEDILTWYDGLITTYPQFVTKKVFGKTVQNRDMVAYHITSSSNTQPKKQIFFMSLIHAREWLAAPVLAYTALKMIEENASVLDILELVIVPVANPDGILF